MAKHYIIVLIVRLLLPSSLLLSMVLRPFGFSIIYLLLYSLAPLIGVPDERTFKGYRGNFLLMTAVISSFLFGVHLMWHSVLAAFPPYGRFLDDHVLVSRICHNLGLVSYESIDPFRAVHFMAPELIMMCVSLFVYFSTSKLLSGGKIIDKRDLRFQQFPLVTSAGKYLSLFLIMFSGIMRPSVTSGIYFLVFMGAATAWACGKPLEKGFAVVTRCVMAVMACHVCCILVYQCQWLIELYGPEEPFARYFGLTQLVSIQDSEPNSFSYVNLDSNWTAFASPLIILVTYFILGMESRELFKPKAAFDYINSKALRGSKSETTPLIRAVSPEQKRSTVRVLKQDSTGSIIVPDDESTADKKPKLADDIAAAIIGFFQVLIRSSYIATTITMMTWSIMFHSWLAFVFLMWSNVVWLCPDQRSFMLKTSPLLVLYAMLLLIAQYVYGMDLTEQELPSNITDVNLLQIGLSRYDGDPFVPLLIKALFTCMFWVTLRQRVQEIRTRRQSAVVADLAAPLQLTASTAASAMEAQREDQTESRLLKAFGEWLRGMCAVYWIYVVVIMLFVIGITGERMTIFRIIYMFLFLTFILMFQISWRLWRKFMYTFWIIVIIYSMGNLILVYVYQFDNFSKTIEKYFFINERLQRSLGLEPYLPADLFLKLLTPTLFLIITIMQVHYFHKDFMKYSDPKTRSAGPGSSRPSQGASTMKDDLPPLPLEDEGRQSPGAGSGVTDLDMYSTNLDKSRISEKRPSRAYTVTEPKSRAFKDFAREVYNKTHAFVVEVVDKVFIYLDLHLVKIIFVSLMLLCVMDVCAMHIPIMVMITPCLLMSSRRQRYFILVISILISSYFLAKMVYQIDYIPHSIFDVNCTQETTNGTNITTYNNAKWLGFMKTSPHQPLVSKLKGYIALIALFTFHSLVTYRQQNLQGGEGLEIHEAKEKVMFPKIKRPDAEKDVMHCVKFLFNYCFYKFGIEITLICLVGVIGSRMDVYAMLYAFWLFALISVSRSTQARLWPAFTAFITFVIPMQYIIAVGFMPQFCVQYPWDGDSIQMKHTRTWLYLPHMEAPPHATKLIFDFFLLLFASRQIRVFRVERTKGDDYPGGSNREDIGQDWETPDFVNPVPDFLGLVESWLDMIKRMVFLGMLWVSLAILFLTGTNRVNLFSMGYLIGSFIFLWQGTDFYLRPKHIILLWWSWLLRYNVCVVVIKTLLQIPGCIFSSVLQENACWMVQLFGVGCVDKFAGGNISHFFQMQYTKNSTCNVPQEDIGLAWDGVCFAFLILQRRLFHSYYFYRVIDESKATTVLASRGAELIEELRQKQMFAQEEQEVKILEKIKVKMERIKANQKKVQGALVKEPSHHDREEGEDEESQRGESDKVPLVRGDSDVSERGYHTPQSPASPKGFHTPISDESPASTPSHTPPSVARRPKPPPLPAIPPPSSSHGGPPSPSSALMTVSLDAYLEPRRISFESPPSSELIPRAQSPEESYPVFSPPPIRRRHTLASPSVLHRTSIISESSRAEMLSHHIYVRPRYKYKPPRSHKEAIRSGDYYMFDEFDDTEVQLEEEPSSSEDDEEPKEMGLGKLLSTAYKTDLRSAVSLSRRASLPAVRSRSQHSVVSGPHSYTQDARRDQPPQPILREKQQPPENDEPLSELDDTYDAEEETRFEKLKRLLETAWAFISSGLWSLTRHFMKYSRDYRYVSRTLSIEKKILKEQEGFGMGVRKGSQMIWEPSVENAAFVHFSLQQQKEEMESHDSHLLSPAVEMGRKLSEISVPEIRILAPSMERGLDATPQSVRRAPVAVEAPAPRSDHTCEDEDGTSEHESMFSLQTSESKDITMLEDQDDSMFRQNRSPLLHLGYALWFAVIAHTDIVCFIMVFVNQIQSATILSLPLPLMVFLWGTLTIPRPTKTFWVTLIAYTEVVVIIKSMFQFEILPWNQKAITANQPFAAPRIIGIERKADYALYDLLLLLIIFLHRFMLKSLGLWNESAPEPEIPEEQEFILTAEDTRLVAEGRGEEVGQKYLMLNEAYAGPSLALWRTRGETLLYSQKRRRSDERRRSGERKRSHDHRKASLQRKSMSAERRRSISPGSRQRLSEGLARVKPAPVGKLATRIKNMLQNMRNSIQPRRTVDQGVAVEISAPEASVTAVAEDEEQPGPSKPPPDDHYSVHDEQEPIIAIKTRLEDPYDHYPQVLGLSVRRYLRPVKTFFKRVLEPGARVTADVYAYMFLCDFFNFLVVIFGFAAFGTHQGDGGVQTYLEENKVPIPFLVMLILQFGLIVIDRALYLRKFILGKILFQYALVIGVHIWMFFVLPAVTERTFNALVPPPMWYMVKCIYLLLSAYQIRCGYPRRIIGNFLCKNYGYLNMGLFRGFMAVPFVFELRTLMDWIWTDTSMTLMDWLKMEDIFANVFLLKCSRHIENEYPHPRGEKQTNRNKYLLGGGVLTFMIAIIWFPLVFFAFGNTVGEPNPPTDVTVKIRIGPFLPVYQMSAQAHNIDLYTQLEYAQLSNLYARDRTAQTFLSNYMYNDVAVVGINPTSTMEWVISPPELDRLEREAASNATLMIKFSFVITHPTNSAQNPPTIEDSQEVPLEAYIDNKRNPERDKLLRLLAGNATDDTWLNVQELFPKFLKVFNKGTAKPAYQLMPYPETGIGGPRLYRNVKLRLERGKDAMYWRVHEACEQQDPLSAIPLNNCDMLVMYTFNDKLFPETLNFISGSGIIGLYTTFVFLASRVLRGFFSGIYTKIMFDDLPNVDRVLQLCLDIYLVREALELCLEEDLFAKLVFLYRSPETMIKWSRPKEEENPPQMALVASRGPR